MSAGYGYILDHVHMICGGRTRKERAEGHGKEHPPGLPPRRDGQCVYCDYYANIYVTPKGARQPRRRPTGAGS